MYFPKEKKKRLIVYIGAGVVALLAVVVIILKGDDIARIKVGIDVLKNVFKYPLGNQPAEILGETPNTRNIYLDALYQNGIPSFMLLVGITVVVAITLIKYYKHSNDSQIKKNLILSYIIHYFVYVNLNYGQVVFSDLDTITCIISRIAQRIISTRNTVHIPITATIPPLVSFSARVIFFHLFNVYKI